MRSALLALERTACDGTCPSYLVTVHTDGLVEWDGRDFVKVKGRLSAAELDALKQAAEAKYLALGGGFNCREVTDNPSVRTS